MSRMQAVFIAILITLLCMLEFGLGYHMGQRQHTTPTEQVGMTYKEQVLYDCLMAVTTVPQGDTRGCPGWPGPSPTGGKP